MLFRMLSSLLILSLLPSVLAQKGTSELDKKIKEFEAYVLKAQQEWEVPGVAIALVKDGSPLLIKGFGTQKLGTVAPVNAQTQFACASTTKAMTAVCMGMLVDEGKVKWDDPVVNHFPEFELYDPFVTREIKIRDLFIHDTGLGNADFLWGNMNIPSDEVLKKLKQVKPTYSLRSSFIYQNIFYLAAGKVIEKISGLPWDKFLEKRIFQPLGMTRTVPFLNRTTGINQSTPHDRVDGQIVSIEDFSADNIGPAGSVWSTAEDMAKWMQCMLDSSKFKSGRLLTAASWTEMFKPQVLVPPAQFYPTMQLTKPNWTTYGLGWFQHDYKGKKINFHTGSLAGTVALHAQLPDARLGIYIFANLDHAELRHALVYKAFDLFSLGGTRDWSSEFLTLYKGIRSQGEKQEKEFEGKRVPGTKASLPFTAYAGQYKDPLYGTLIISVEGEKLRVNCNDFLSAAFNHWHFDTFRGWFDKRWYGQSNLVFTLGADGTIAKVNFTGFDFVREK